MSPPSTPPPPSEPKKKKPSKRKNKNKKKNHPPAVDVNVNGADSHAILPPNGFEGTWDSSNANADTASNASFESNASHRRRRARGGRKPKKLQSVIEDGLSPEDQARLEEEQLREAERQLIGAVDESEPAPPSASIQDERDEQEDYQGGAELQPEMPVDDHAVNGIYEQESQPEPQPEPKKFETGIKAFNIRKADPSGGRPMGAKIHTRGIGGQQQEQLQQQPQQQQQHHQQHPHQQHHHYQARQRRHHPQQQQQSHQQQQQHQTPQKPQHPPQHPQQHIPPLSQTQAQPQTQGSESKEVSIKVDLNLEVEILLKAKIKGEIMITFL